jgi:tRNA dimethylallyltransferase
VLGAAERLAVEVVSMDSAMVYRGLDIGTAKPSAAVRSAVPHHLVDIVEPTDSYSAGRFARDAAEAIADIAARGRVPVLVGGTLLYLRALREGLAGLPSADPEVRRRLDEQAAEQGWAALHARLQAVDPEAAARIAASDRQRIQRALEVYELTGRALSELQRRERGDAGLEVVVIALVPEDRTELAIRIERRFDAMVEQGFVDEVRALKGRGDLDPGMPSMRAVGYRQIWAYLADQYDWHEARRRAIIATRQLAKRQLTWLRSERCERWPAFSAGLGARLLARLEESTWSTT